MHANVQNATLILSSGWRALTRRLDVIGLERERTVADAHVERDAADRRQNARRSVRADVVQRGREQRRRDVPREDLGDESGAVGVHGEGGGPCKSASPSRFEAAHVLPHHPGKCARLHGHSYRLEVALEGPLQQAVPAAGMVEDFDVVSRVVRAAVLDELDHRSLNELIDNPTAEHIVLWVWRRLAPELPALAELTLWETPSSSVVLRKGDPLSG